MAFFEYIQSNMDLIISLLIEHLFLSFIAVGLAILIGVPIGILIAYGKRMDKPVLKAASVIQAVPSIALLGFMIPFLGIGTMPAVVMVVLYSLLPIIKNTYIGIQGINPDMIEAAKGIGLKRNQILRKIQIPLALPVIMGGIRVSAVTAVGLMTIAAFVGGGGLGYLVFSGIRTVNNFQILAGAIPACILALLIDYVFALIEKAVTPKSLQPKGKRPPRINPTVKKVIAVIAVLAVIVGGIIYGVSKSESKENSIVISSKDYTEQEILCHMISDLIEDRTQINVVRKPALGGTTNNLNAITSDEVDMYVEYLGTAYGDVLKHEPISDVDEVYAVSKKEYKEKFNIEVLEQFSFNNTYALGIRRDTAEAYNIKTVSDLQKVSEDLVLTATLEFLNRNDGLLGLEKTYNLQFKNVLGVDGGPRYIALMNNESDVVDIYTTDGLIKKFDLVVLEDDKDFFPPYYAVPIVRGEVLEKHPEIVPIMAELGPYLTNEVMTDLNYKVDELSERPAAVAYDFLKVNNLLKNEK